MASNPLWAATPEDVAKLPRNAVHDMIDRLINWLDNEDGDPDLEPNGDEGDYSDGDGGHCGAYGVDQSKGPMSGNREEGPAEVRAAATIEATEVRPFLGAPTALATNKPALVGPHLILPDPEEIPDLYACIGQGTCMEPDVADGACLAFDKTAEVRPGDTVIIWFKPGVRLPHEPQSWLKRLVIGAPREMLGVETGGFAPIIVVEQLNPPQRYHIPCSHVRAIHKCIGVAQSAGDGRAAIPLSMWKEVEARRCEREARP